MGTKNTDLRVIRTKESIRQALVELIEEKGFESITVKDLTMKARINRGTFYAHYQDKFDLMNKCEKEIMLDLSSMTKQNYSSVITALEVEDAQSSPPFTLTVSLFEYLNTNSGFLKAVLGPKGDLSFQLRLKEFMWDTLYGNNSNAFIKEENLRVPSCYLAAYMGTAIIGVIQEWLGNGSKESPQEMARILTTMMVNGPYFAAGLKK
ncbi:TetR/AcrR family transcriptional regulator [Planococcus shenhongbingii]|uniref:TetR/AcrR family transcriptional regulator n=1 Tax=Planococcus shenhongbingii TaxID=3058398 RepID=UPI002634C829|nr:TetR/AcrR family transcriptional regulator [Planococcus sp. N016]WKA60218.1 TetR/AcrR family transcriptional regulator [Planococcus sp. N016]